METKLLIGVLLSTACLVGILVLMRKAMRGVPSAWLEQHTNDVDALPLERIGAWIALASGASLFTELALIRFHSSCFHLFAYFKNVSLLSCFLGLGIGFARAERRPLATPLVLPLLALQVVTLYALRFHDSFRQLLQNPIAEQLTLGMDSAAGLGRALLAYGFLAAVFVVNALTFVPMGHLISRLMSRQPGLVAYGWNLAGSVGGIVLFSLVSYLWMPPVLWMCVVALAWAAFLQRSGRGLAGAGAALLLMTAVLSGPFSLGKFDLFSPYQILSLDVRDPFSPVLETSNAAYQRIHDFRPEAIAKDVQLAEWARYYDLPYKVVPQPGRVLVIGSGTGNDVAAALRNGAGSVDAVEIDPVILGMGRQLHPERPYDSEKVTGIVADARSFVRHATQRYDLVVYGLLDSHVLLSGISGGIRLDSYVYTVEGLTDARSRLAPGGVLCLTFCNLSPALSHKIYLMVCAAFAGVAPRAYASGYAGAVTYVAGADPEQLRRLGQRYVDITRSFADPSLSGDVSTDDWPFLYMPERVYPQSYLWMIGLLLVLSIVLLARLAPLERADWSWPAFFLGAGFMLVETKGITELALVYSSTWHVTGIVILAILVLAFLANLLVQRIARPSLALAYALLFAALLAGYGLTFQDLGGLPLWLHRMVKSCIVTLPLFFSGLAFSSLLQRGGSVPALLSANLLGAMVGGFLEYNSMYFGFRFLYLVALAMYLLAGLTSRGRAATS